MDGGGNFQGDAIKVHVVAMVSGEPPDRSPFPSWDVGELNE